jgi:acetyl-CoA acetyltransferase
MKDIYIAGIAMTVFGRHIERPLADLAREALDGALKDANCATDDLGVAFYAGMTNGPLQGQISIPGQVVFSKIGVEGIPVYNHLAADQAYEQAGLGPRDMHVAEVHDASAMGEIVQAENLGLVALGEGGPAAERGDFTVGGRIPINTSGGLESKGHPLGATGIGQLHELVTQLRGEAGKRQVEGARHAIQENGGGSQGVEEAAVAIHILSNS